jgi:ADP-heptose:LPS heptosyltransferase
MTVNEVRELENLNPIGPEGDQHFIQLNMTTLEKAGQEPPAVEPPAVEIEDSQEDDAEDLAEEQEQTDGT